MATGVQEKTNERPGVRSQVRYARMSASKARAVLDLIRGKHVEEAGQILAFSERRAAGVIDKCLKAAIANAEHNEEIDADELYVGACYADEGPTLKRFRPRARGRAGRIRKQTCHITVVVSRYSDDELDERRRRDAERSSGGTRNADARAQRRQRVARSRAADEAEPETTDAADDTTEPDDTVAEAEATETEVVEAEVVEAEVADTVEDADDDAEKSKEAD